MYIPFSREAKTVWTMADSVAAAFVRTPLSSVRFNQLLRRHQTNGTVGVCDLHINESMPVLNVKLSTADLFSSAYRLLSLVASPTSIHRYPSPPIHSWSRARSAVLYCIVFYWNSSEVCQLTFRKTQKRNDNKRESCLSTLMHFIKQFNGNIITISNYCVLRFSWNHYYRRWYCF